MFLETFNDDSRELHGHPKEVQSVFQGSFIDLLRKFQGCFNKVSSLFQELFKKKFQGCFKNVSISFFFNFVFARISSQLPEQKEGLFFT